MRKYTGKLEKILQQVDAKAAGLAALQPMKAVDEERFLRKTSKF